MAPTPAPTPIPTQAAAGYPQSIPNDNPCPQVISGLTFYCFTFVVSTTGGAPLAGVCAVAGSSSTDPSAVTCLPAHYTTNAQGVVAVGTLGAPSATFFFLYPGKPTVKMDVTGSGTRTIQMP